MRQVKLLDCTLRDGGFVNNWAFGEDCIINIFERLEMAGIDIIEVGYLRDYVEYDVDKTEFPHTKYISEVIPKPMKKSTMVVAIVDFGNYSLDRIEPCVNSVLDGIRVTFKKEERDEALKFCSKIKELGYLVSIQPVSIMDYTPQDVIDLVNEVNKLDPFAVCIVDTYGFMHKRDLLRYFFLMDSTLLPQISLGYHSHNNFQLAYSNATELIEQYTNRDIILDCSVFGMGKGAGNANTELLALYLNENYGASYNLDQLLEIIDTNIEKEREKNFWGYSLKYYLAAANDCHHQYISFLLDKKTLSIKAINEIMAQVELTKKTKFDQDYIISLYKDYQKNMIDDAAAYKTLSQVISDNPILIVAPGNSVKNQLDIIEEYIRNEKPWIISVNHVSDTIDADAIFISNAKRYSQIALRLKKYSSKAKIIATSNITPSTLTIDYRLNYSDLLNNEAVISDNSTLLLLNALIKLGLKRVAIAGFDGYSKGGINYYDDNLDFKGNMDEQNHQIRKAIVELSSSLSIRFVTDSLYCLGGGKFEKI